VGKKRAKAKAGKVVLGVHRSDVIGGLTRGSSMTTSETALLYSNVLMYGHQALSPFHHDAMELPLRGLGGKILVCVCPIFLTHLWGCSVS
jgi:hypothetical protein